MAGNWDDIPALSSDLDVIQKLDDEPNDVGGLSAAELKRRFDAAPNEIKEYINTVLLPAIRQAGNADDAQLDDKLSRSGGRMLGDLNMGGFYIDNLATPAASSHAATKGYVDIQVVGKQDKLTIDSVPTEQSANPVASGGVHSALTDKISRYGDYMRGDLNMQYQKLLCVPEPTEGDHPATKNYVDTKVWWYIDSRGGTMTGPLYMSGQRVFGLPDPATSSDAATKGYVDRASGSSGLFWAEYGATPAEDIKAAIEAGKMVVCYYQGLLYTNPEHLINLEFSDEYRMLSIKMEYSGSLRVNVIDVTDETWTYSYFDLEDTFLPLYGGTMTGNVNMGANKVTNLAAPTNDADAATKKYVDDAIAAALAAL